MIEEFKDIIGYEGLYKISNLGRIKSLDRWVNALLNQQRFIKSKILKNRFDKSGYCLVNLYKQNKRKTIKVHREVAKAFISNPDNKPQINHINGIKSDNRINNLEWCNSSENGLHAYKTGLKKPTIMTKDIRDKLSKLQSGEKSSKAKFKNSEIIQIRENYKSGATPLELSIKHNVNIVTIRYIIKNKTYKNI